MYKPKKVLDYSEVLNFIDGNDVYNSAFLINLENVTNMESYTCTRIDKRTDLLAKSLDSSESLLVILNKLNKGERTKKVNYLTTDELNKLITSSMK